MSAWSNTDTNSSKPKWLNMNDGNFNNANVYGVDSIQVGVFPSTNSAGYKASHVGWVKVIPQYTDSSGNVRKKSEVLVALASMTGNANNVISGNVAVSHGSVNVVGTNTRFTTEVKVGDILTINGGNTRSVISVTNATFLAVNTAFSANGANLKLYLTDQGQFPSA